MATGAFFNALNYRLWVKAGTTASTVPTASTTMTEVLSVTNAGIQTNTDVQEVLDYGSSLGFKAKVVTGNSYSIPMEMNLDLNDAGYAVLKQAALDAPSGVTVQWYRESPEMSATGSPEKHAGVAFVTNFSESIQAGNVATVSFTLDGYGAFTWTAETNA
jgi:hypothetical protein